MNLLFQIELKKIVVGSIGFLDYQLDFDLKLLNYQLSSQQYSSKDFLNEYFTGLMKDEYSELILKSGSEGTEISFGRNLIQLSMKMSSEKLQSILKYCGDIGVKKRYLRVELSQDELSKFPSKENIEDDVRDRIKIFFYKFEFVY